jgi:radical SAM superfamily enzyme YgiQ (UPF0313 family)
MRALFVWPKFDSFSFWNFEKVCEIVGVKYMTPPLGLLTVAALLPQDWEIRLVDENVAALSDQDLDWASIVFVGSKIVHRGRALEVIRRAKRRNLAVVVGGPDPTMNPDPYRDAGADYLCLGEGEATVPMLLSDLERGVPKGMYRSDDLPDLRHSPIPRFDLIDHRDYLYVGIQYSRGCPYHCEFCNVIDLFKNKYRTKTHEQVLGEMQRLYDLGYRGQLDFFDDNLAGNMVGAKALLRAVAEWLEAHGHPFTLSTSLTLNVAKDPELLALLRRARFKYFLVGIETPSEAALKAAQKPQNTGFSIAEAADTIYREAGATIHSGFLLGLDGEPADIADQVIQCIDQAAIPWVMAGVVYPLPGTQLSKRLDREGRLFPPARHDMPAGARDQISAGLQFRPERPAKDVLADLVRVMRHSFDAEHYFERVARVATRLNTVPVIAPSARVFVRNLRTFSRLCFAMLRKRTTRRPFFRALTQVLLHNRAGTEALATLSVLYLHFEAMLPYCYEQLEKQTRALEELGEDGWLARNLREPNAERDDRALPSVAAVRKDLHVLRTRAASGGELS